MKLLVFAQTPPPVHGQSVMVRTLVDGLGAAAGAGGSGDAIEVIHVNPGLSRDAADVGRVRVGKIFALWAACWRALWARVKHRGAGRGGVVLYYVPAPGKRVAVWRDLMVMFSLRPFFSQLVLHWHAAGLGAWVTEKASAPERWLTRLALARADAAIVLAPELADDALVFAPKKICVVANGVDVAKKARAGISTALRIGRGVFDFKAVVTHDFALAGVTRLLFLGTCSREKGVFAALDALAALERETPGAFALTVAGEFACEEERREFNARLATDNAQLKERVRYAGAADEEAKAKLYAEADVFVFPTRYAHEAQPLVLIEAMGHDLAIVTTRWRAIPGMLPGGDECGGRAQLVEIDASGDQIAGAVRRASGVMGNLAAGVMRAHYERHFTREAHLSAMAKVLSELAEGD